MQIYTARRSEVRVYPMELKYSMGSRSSRLAIVFDGRGYHSIAHFHDDVIENRIYVSASGKQCGAIYYIKGQSMGEDLLL